MDVVVYNKIQQEADRLARLIEQGGGGGSIDTLLAQCAADTVVDLYSDGIEAISRNYLFFGQSNLETIDLPNATFAANTGMYICQNCEKLRSVRLIKTFAPHTGFYRCGNLERVDILSRIAPQSFNSCAKLKQVVLRKDGNSADYDYPTLENANAFSGTPFRNGGGGVVYVRPKFVNVLLTKTNWSSLESTTVQPLYIAATLAEKAALLADVAVPSGAMIVCDVDKSYTVKGA